ncbi:MAG: lamin tail domain-containing protein [Calditrichaeota bacterium]|nr:lamin tail domain-containing protein [Calditrichota bacterium]
MNFNTRFSNLLFLILFLIPAQALFAQIVFSEVMFDVPGADYHDEFIEFYNCSDSAIDLTGWQFSDSTGTDNIIETGEGTLLQPGQFALLLDGSYFENSTTYDSVIPPAALVLTIDNGAFGSNGLSNSKPEQLILSDASGRIVAVYRYTIDNPPGYSDEKIVLCAGNDESNWANSLVMGGTPGFANSVSPRDLDIGFAENGMRIVPTSAVTKGQTVRITLVFANFGVNLFKETIHLRTFIDLNENGVLEVLEPIIYERQLAVDLPPGALDSVAFDYIPEFSGVITLVAQIVASPDQNSLNNQIRRSLTVMDVKNPLVINEIKFLTRQDEPEWIELFNKGGEPVSLRGWAISDDRDTSFIDSSIVIYPNSFKILTSDSSVKAFYDLSDSLIVVLKHFPTLNNDQDKLFLLAPWGAWVEQAPYRSDWLLGEDWRKPSLERINPELDARMENNWGPSAAKKGATPGAVNSLFEPVRSPSLSLSVDPNPFSPDGDGFEDNTIIGMKVPAKAAKVRVTIFDVLGRKIITLSDNQLVGQSYQLTWNGRDSHKKKVRMGIYVVFAQILNASDGILKEAKTTVVVAY